MEAMNDELARLENLREACALEAIEALIEAGEDPRAADSLGDRLRDVPLDATPLADALARAEEGVRYWTDLAQAEARDAATLRARVAELEAEVEAQRASSQRHMNGRESYWVEQRTKWIAECDRIGESCKWHAARAVKAEAERDALRAWVSAVSEALGAIEPVSDCRVELSADAAAALAESLRAQVEAARALLNEIEDTGGVVWPADVLRAMDEAKNE